MDKPKQKKIMAYSVRCAEVIDISDRAVLVKSFNGAKDVIPRSQIFGYDYSVQKCDAIWIAAWILEKKSIQYSKKKVAFFGEDGQLIPYIKVTKHVPEKKKAQKTNPDVSLIR